MKVAILFEPRQPLSVEDVTVDAPRAHDVLIRTAAAGVCRSAGAGKIVALDPVAERRTLTSRPGTTYTVDALADTAAGEVAISRGGIHHVVEAVGRPRSAAIAVKVLRRRHRGDPGHAAATGQIGVSAMDLPRGKRLQGGPMGSNRLPAHLPRPIDFYQRPAFHLGMVIAERLPLERIDGTFAGLRKDDATCSVMVFG